MSPRPRSRAPNMPRHIDLRDIPRGVYWDPSGRGRWYVFVMVDGKKARETIAPPSARASDLHRIMEERGGVRHGTLSSLLRKFHDSPKFARLAERTRKDYEAYRKAIDGHKIRAGTVGGMELSRLSAPWFRALFDSMHETPTKANHWLRYLRRVFRWGIQAGIARANPLTGVEGLQERKLAKMPSKPAHAAFLARIDGWLLAACELAYLCRLRRVEVITLMESAETDAGIVSNRRKGSRDNVTKWSPRLRSAWDLAIRERDARWQKLRMAVPMRAEDRPVFVNRQGARMTEDGFSTAFTRAMDAFVEAGGERFSIHGLKHRGITDSADKRAGGHRTEAMRQRYDHELPAFEAAGITEAITEAPKRGA